MKSLEQEIYEYLKTHKEPSNYKSIKKDMNIRQPIYSEIINLVMKGKIKKIEKDDEFFYVIS